MGVFPSAELTTFNDELIARNGLFFDTRPFARNWKEYAGFESPGFAGNGSFAGLRVVVHAEIVAGRPMYRDRRP